jgi:hypothetical protein
MQMQANAPARTLPCRRQNWNTPAPSSSMAPAETSRAAPGVGPSSFMANAQSQYSSGGFSI